MIKKILKIFIPKPIWKMLRGLYRLEDSLSRIDHIENITQLARYEANGQVLYIYPLLKSSDIVDGRYYGLDVFEIPRRVAIVLPDFPHDYMSYVYQYEADFYEQGLLEELNRYIPQSAVILDIGANIGNHSLYWGLIRKASRILAFEPIASTFDALSKNIRLNNLQDIVTPFNIGLGDEKRAAHIGGCLVDRKLAKDVYTERCSISLEYDKEGGGGLLFI